MIVMDVQLPDYLTGMYRDGFDKNWCTDFEGRHVLLADLGVRCWTKEFHRCKGDEFYLSLMHRLPIGSRFVVEMRTGLWAGDGVPHDFETMGEALGISAGDAREVYERAIDALWPHVHPGEQRPMGATTKVRKKYPQKNRPPIPPGDRFRVFKRDGYRCRICGASADDGAVLHIDHIIPVSLRGTNDESNLQTLCRDCNFGKRDRLM
jgi:5-methylcytosine-specific restriction endonuclease McrA